MSEDDRRPTLATDRSEHLASVHGQWSTPVGVLAAAVGDVTTAPLLDVRRIVAGEQNEVYDVTLERSPPMIVRIAHARTEAHDREVWVIGQCEARGIRVPRVHALRRIGTGTELRSIMVMEKLPGERLSDLDAAEIDTRRVLREVGAWLKELHSIPVQGLGYLDRSGVGKLATVEAWLAEIASGAKAFEEAGRSVGLEGETIRDWLNEIVDSVKTDRPRVALIHNDLLVCRQSGSLDYSAVMAVQ